MWESSQIQCVLQPKVLQHTMDLSLLIFLQPCNLLAAWNSWAAANQQTLVQASECIASTSLG